MKYSVIRTDKFNDQLTDIILYINATFFKKGSHRISRFFRNTN